ncbi:MAG: TlpA family protein disulfide reductase [Oscillospiraceae bacterium]|nr:TlpA family protein disulfide reductase [Oscillospiraceae bacterium]
MKIKIIIFAILLIAVVVGATVLYNVLRDRAELDQSQLLQSMGQQVAITGDPLSKEQQVGGTQTQTDVKGDNTATSLPDGGAIEDESQATSDETDGANTQKDEHDDNVLIAPDFTVQDTEGNDVKLSDMRGKPVVLNFWASWCPPCKAELPDFDKVFGELGEDVQFMMVCIADGNRETVATGTNYIEEGGFTFPVFFDTSMEASTIYDIRSIPTTYFVDADGVLITRAQGAINEEILRVGIEMIG